MVKIGPFTITRDKKTKRQNSGAAGEIGHIGKAMFKYFVDEEYLPALRWPANLKVYDKMRRSDGQIQAVLFALELPIRSTRWYVKPASEDSKDKQIAEFVEENLMDGMKYTWDDTLRLALTMLPFGHSVFEKVYTVDSHGYLKWEKFAERPQTTISSWVADKNGNLEAVEQMTPNSTVPIPESKLLPFTHRREGGDPRGLSVLRTAYKHWYIKDFVYKIVNIGIEQEYVGIPWATHEGNITPEVRRLLESFLEGLTKGDKSWGYFPNNVQVHRYQPEREQSGIMPYIEHHDLMIARSVLAQFLNLAGAKTGSYSLSEDQSDLFLMTLDSVANYIGNVINRKAIPELVSANWNVDKYPKLAHDPVGGRDPSKLVDSVQKMTNTVIKPDGPLEDFMRDYLGLPEAERDANQPTGQVNPFQQEKQGIEDEDDQSGGEPEGDEETDGGEDDNDNDQDPRTLAEGLRWRRDLTTWEQRIKLDELEDMFDTVEERFMREGNTEALSVIREVWPQIERFVRQGDIDSLLNLRVNNEAVAAWLEQFKVEVMEQAGAMAAEELGLPSLPRVDGLKRSEVKAISTIAAGNIVNKIMDRLKAEGARKIIAGSDPDEILQELQDALEEQAKRALTGEMSAQVNESVNAGRNLAAEVAKAEKAQYSAILDERVCPLCEELDGKIVEVDSREFRKFSPPLHHMCRCIWAFILPEEDPQPAINWSDPSDDLIEQHGALLN